MFCIVLFIFFCLCGCGCVLCVLYYFIHLYWSLGSKLVFSRLDFFSSEWIIYVLVVVVFDFFFVWIFIFMYYAVCLRLKFLAIPNLFFSSFYTYSLRFSEGRMLLTHTHHIIQCTLGSASLIHLSRYVCCASLFWWFFIWIIYNSFFRHL